MDLSGRTVLITGGSSGIGLGLAEAFHMRGSTVILCGRNQEALAAAAEKLPGIVTIVCDVADAQQRKDLAANVLKRFPELDVLINNAGVQKYIDLKKGYAELVSGEDEITINFVAVVELTALFVKHLLTRPEASVVNIGSGLAFMPTATAPIYCATKAAIHTYTLLLRHQLKDTSVQVVEIVPPLVDTNLNRAGREASGRPFRGVSLEEYLPTAIKGLEDGSDTVLTAERQDLFLNPRGETENMLLKQSW